MQARRRLSRRSFLARVHGGVAAAGALTLVVGRGAGLPGDGFGQRPEGGSGRPRPRPHRRERRRSHRSRRLWPPAHRLHRRRQRHQWRSRPGAGRCRTGESDSDSDRRRRPWPAAHRDQRQRQRPGRRRRPGAAAGGASATTATAAPTGDPPGRGRRCMRRVRAKLLSCVKKARKSAANRIFSVPKGFPGPHYLLRPLGRGETTAFGEREEVADENDTKTKPPLILFHRRRHRRCRHHGWPDRADRGRGVPVHATPTRDPTAIPLGTAAIAGVGVAAIPTAAPMAIPRVGDAVVAAAAAAPAAPTATRVAMRMASVRPPLRCPPPHRLHRFRQRALRRSGGQWPLPQPSQLQRFRFGPLRRSGRPRPPLLDRPV